MRSDLQPAWPSLANHLSSVNDDVNIGQAKSELSRRIAAAEAGEEVDIAKDGVPVVRLIPIGETRPGSKFLAAAGSLRGKIQIGDDFEFTDAELDEILEP
jgi:antitoxin (DNA-binding transcriptional repressor) of toxin-antitoxin stability system